MKLRTLTKQEAEKFIVSLLKREGRLSTKQVQKKALAKNVQCSDSTSRALNSLRLEGKIKGSFSIKEKKWIWYVQLK